MPICSLAMWQPKSRGRRLNQGESRVWSTRKITWSWKIIDLVCFGLWTPSFISSCLWWHIPPSQRLTLRIFVTITVVFDPLQQRSIRNIKHMSDEPGFLLVLSMPIQNTLFKHVVVLCVLLSERRWTYIEREQKNKRIGHTVRHNAEKSYDENENTISPNFFLNAFRQRKQILELHLRLSPCTELCNFNYKMRGDGYARPPTYFG